MDKRKLIAYLILVIMLFTGSISTVYGADYFNLDDINKGLIKITYDGGGKIKAIIQKGDKKYTYDINSSGVMETLPLQMGNGSYKVSLYKNTSGNSYKLITSENVDLNLTNLNTVYLTSIQIINWNVDSKAVTKAVELTKDIKDLEKKASVLWNYMVKNNAYDYDKLGTLKSGYLPVIDTTLAEKKGICYDFSALYAAMLRSQGTPAKLIKGYAPKNASGYHAWNEVYDQKLEKWVVIDTTYDIQVIGKNPKVTMLKNTSDFDKVYEY